MAHVLRSISPRAVDGPPSGDVYAFGPVCVDVARHVVTREGQPIALAPKTFELLLTLVRSGGRVLTRQELVETLWPDTFVEEANLSFQMSALRKALGEGAEQWIETVPKVGYRFTSDVARVPRDRADEAPVPDVVVAVPRTVDAAGPPSPRHRAFTVLVTGLTAAVALILSALWVAQFVRARAPAAAGGSTPSVRSIAVLPFEDMSAGKQDEHYADGLTEALITELSVLEGFDKIIGRQSVARFRTAPVPVPEAARALGVDAIVTASLLRSSGRLRVTARLVDGATERHLWAATYERPDGEVLLIQRQIVEAIAGAVHLALGPNAVARMPKVRAVDAAAFEAYIAGRQAVNVGPQNSVAAIAHFERATTLDPDFAPAYAALANALWRGSMHGVPPRDAFRRGKAAAARAIALDPNLGEAHAAAGLLALHGDWDWDAADTSLRRAVALSPNNALVRLARSHHLVVAGHYDEAIDEGRRSVELDPSALLTRGGLAWTLLHARQYDESVRRWRQIDEFVQDPFMQGLAILALGLAGRANDLQVYCPDEATRPLAWRCAQARALLGHAGPARVALASAPSTTSLLVAEMHAAVGDAAATVGVLERAYDIHSSAVLFMNSPAFDPVRQDASFRSLQRRLNYPVLAEANTRINRD